MRFFLLPPPRPSCSGPLRCALAPRFCRRFFFPASAPYCRRLGKVWRSFMLIFLRTPRGLAVFAFFRLPRVQNKAFLPSASTRGLSQTPSLLISQGIDKFPFWVNALFPGRTFIQFLNTAKIEVFFLGVGTGWPRRGRPHPSLSEVPFLFFRVSGLPQEGGRLRWGRMRARISFPRPSVLFGVSFLFHSVAAAAWAFAGSLPRGSFYARCFAGRYQPR